MDICTVRCLTILLLMLYLRLLDLKVLWSLRCNELWILTGLIVERIEGLIIEIRMIHNGFLYNFSFELLSISNNILNYIILILFLNNSSNGRSIRHKEIC